MYNSVDPTLFDWYHNYQIDFSALTRPPKLYDFQDPDLERMAFTNNNNEEFYSMPGATRRYTNPSYERLEWLGDSILKFLVNEALYTIIPDFGEHDLSALSQSILNNEFLAYLSRRLGFHRRINIPSISNEENSVKRLTGAFQAYIGAFYEEVGLQNLYILHDWFRVLIEPYVRQFHVNFLNFKSARYGAEIVRPATISPTPSRRYNIIPTSRISSYHDESPRKPSCGLQSSAANDYSIPPRPSSTVSSHTHSSMGTYSMQLKELAEGMRRPMPEYRFTNNGQMGDAISWCACVYLDGQEYGSAWAKNKKEAQHAASHKALQNLKIEWRTNLPYYAS